MANIILTNVCNAYCAFCFALEQAKSPGHFLSLDDFTTRISFIRASDQSQIRLMGGEPTLHPKFKEIVDLIISNGMTAILFSNGYISDTRLQYLESLPVEKIALLVNLNAKWYAPNSEVQRLEVFTALNKKITLGFTILNPIFDLTQYFEWIKTYQLQPKLRLGLAQPTLFGDNQYLSPKLYKKAAQSILINAYHAHRQNIQLEFDCGFVRCMFTEEEWHQLDTFGVVSECRCAPNLDIDLDGHIFHCFSLSQISTPLNQHQTINAAYSQIEDQIKNFRESGIYPNCSTCQEKINGQCSGGCLSITMRRFHGLTPAFLDGFFSNHQPLK